MGAIYYLFHPNELRAIIQWKVWHDAPHKREPEKETPELRECFRFLDLTSRSFSAVIQELNHELLIPIALFYLVLRGLDTIEDDMTIPLEKKVPILRNFHETMLQDGWQFHESQEKDRELLEKFDVVVVELKKLKPKYLDIIKEKAREMGNGMADYVQNDDMIRNGVMTVKEYEKYCHYVAGTVGEGLTGLFLSSDLANPKLRERPALTESMGQFLQKTNIIRDIHEDWESKRRWYPKEIWGKHVDRWEDLFDPKHRDAALNCLSEMVLNALKHASDCLFYMAAMREQSVFNFVSIPQGMAMATLALLFRNPDVFEKNVKITKGEACQVMTEATQNLEVLSRTFRRYVRIIQKKNDPRDPNFLEISAQCAEIEQFIDTLFPKTDPKELVKAQEKKAKGSGSAMDNSETMIFLGIAFLCMIFVAGSMIFVAWLFGAQFGRIFQGVMGNLPDASSSASVSHEEL